ncbi:MAG: nucleoside triphosphate pyrophosphohydrolase [Beijerinckiaceae bacterium]|jgi:ATP diphosphatase|nr:nucleoside triphosphate pyrophosphohydrolase [Beijerinckiaceae bacterium]
MKPTPDLAQLLAIMAALRHPETGCPWDIVQSFESIAHYTLEEAQEVVDAIRRGDLVDLKEELGDLLLQVVFHARMAEEQGAFAFPDVVEAINRKLIRRHPHVFGDRNAGNPGAVKELWDRIKAEEKAERAAARAAAGLPDDRPKGLLGGVKTALPALERAVRLQDKAGTVGFDWNNAELVLDKIAEETSEVREALRAGEAADIEEEIGDLLFVMANLARHAKVDPETALDKANAKFIRRFRAIETALEALGRTLADASLEEMEALWVAAKTAEKA